MSKKNQLHIIKVEVTHGSDRHDIALYSNHPPTVAELMKELEKKTRVPFSFIQLIFKGQKLHFQPNAPLVQFGLFSGNRIMMIGEKLNQSQDAVFRRILGINKDVELIVKSLNESINEFNVIESNGVDRSMSKEYLPQLHKRVVGMKRDLEAFYSVLNEVDLNKYNLPNDVNLHHTNIRKFISDSIHKTESLIHKISRLI